MNPLVWVEWGEAIWQIAFLLCVGFGAAWRWSGPRRHAKREARSWIVPATPVERFEEGANTIVEGTLEGGFDSVLVDGATVACIQGLANSAIDQVPLALHVDDEVIELEGNMELLLGSEEIRPRATFQRDGALHARVCALPDGPLAAGQLEGQRYVIRWLRAGDRVQARGVLRRAAAQGEAGYRETQGRWVLRGSDQRPLTLGSARRPVMAQKDVDRLAIGALLGALVFAGAFIGVPALLHNSMPADGANIHDYEAVAVALALTPLHREDAMESLRSIWHADPDERELERLARLVDELDGCHGPSMLWAMHGATQRAIDAASTCDHPVARLAAARAHYAQGNMAEASRALQDVRDELELGYSPTPTPVTSRATHAIGATRAHLARARWRTAANELDRAWLSTISCVGDVARRRAGLDASFLSSSGEPCLVLEASEQIGDPGMLQMLQHSSVAHLLMRERDPNSHVFATRERSHLTGETLALSEMELGIPTEATCPIDPRGAPGLERSVLAKLVEQRTDDQRTRQLVATLAARRVLIEVVAGEHGRATEFMAILQRAGRIGEQERLSEFLELWNPRAERPPLPDAMASAAWNDHQHDRDELLRFTATTTAARNLIELGPDRPVLGTFREHFCDAAARATAAARAGMPDIAREQRSIARRFRALLEGRRASIMLWVLDRRAE